MQSCLMSSVDYIDIYRKYNIDYRLGNVDYTYI